MGDTAPTQTENAPSASNGGKILLLALLVLLLSGVVLGVFFLFKQGSKQVTQKTQKTNTTTPTPTPKNPFSEKQNPFAETSSSNPFDALSEKSSNSSYQNPFGQ